MRFLIKLFHFYSPHKCLTHHKWEGKTLRCETCGEPIAMLITSPFDDTAKPFVYPHFKKYEVLLKVMAYEYFERMERDKEKTENGGMS